MHRAAVAVNNQMNIRGARALAAAWINTIGNTTPGYLGAWFSGSTPLLTDDAPLPRGSDIDIVLLLDGDELPAKPGKFRFADLLLEVTYLSRKTLHPTEALLADYHIGNSLWSQGRDDFIIDDPIGVIGAAHRAVRQHFDDEQWVQRRLESVHRRIVTGLSHHPDGSAFHDHFLAWLFPTGVLCHLPLVAALRNPTIRRRYVAARDVLEEYGFGNLHTRLLETLGSAHMTHSQVQMHLNRLEATFDAAANTPMTDLPFASDITPAARAIAIDGAQTMRNSGDHREAVFWIAATFARCHAVLAINEADLGKRLYPYFQTLADEMGVGTIALLRQRADHALAALPALWEASQSIVELNPDIAHNR